MTVRSEAARRRERERKYVKAEAETWTAYGWVTMINWREAQYIGGGKLITKPRDFFGTKDQAGYDLMGVYPELGQVVGIQVTESPFFRTDLHGGADRNAAHGPPPFKLQSPGVPVSALMEGEFTSLGIAQVIVSYSDPKHPDRRWWVADAP